MSIFESSSSERFCHGLLLAYCTVGVAANILLLAAGLRSPHVRKVPLNVLAFFTLASDLLTQFVGALSTAVSLHTNTTPDARPVLCQVQGILTIFGCSLGFCALTAITISRYYVIVKKRHLTRRQYAYMVIGCICVSLLNIAILLHYPWLISLNAGKLVCAVDWSDSDDPMHIYVITSNLVLWNCAIAVSFLSYAKCFLHLKAIKQAVSELNACAWDRSKEIVLFRRLFVITAVLTASWSVLAYQVWQSAISQQPVSPGIDRYAICQVGLFMALHPFALLRINVPLRHAVRDMLGCRRAASVLPTTTASKRGRRLSSIGETIEFVTGDGGSEVSSVASTKQKTLGRPRTSHTATPSHAITAGLDRHYHHQHSVSRSVHTARRVLATDRNTASMIHSVMLASPMVHVVTSSQQPSPNQQRFTRSFVHHDRTDSQDELYHSIVTSPSPMPPLHPPTATSLSNSGLVGLRSYHHLTTSAPLMTTVFDLSQDDGSSLFIDPATAADTELTLYPHTAASTASNPSLNELSVHAGYLSRSRQSTGE